MKEPRQEPVLLSRLSRLISDRTMQIRTYSKYGGRELLLLLLL